jgi:hypothetical protein
VCSCSSGWPDPRCEEGRRLFRARAGYVTQMMHPSFTGAKPAAKKRVLDAYDRIVAAYMRHCRCKGETQ